MSINYDYIDRAFAKMKDEIREEQKRQRHRDKIRDELRLLRLLAYHNIPDVTEADIDAAIEGPKRAE